MVVTPDTSIFLAEGEPQDITEEFWVDTLAAAGSFEVDALWEPYAPDQRPAVAADLYHLVTDARQRASYWLAKAFAEHGAGANQDSVLWRGETRSWGNATSVRLSSLTGWFLYFDPVRNRAYIRYRNVIDSLRDALFRVVDPEYVYVREGRRSIRQVAERFVGISENTERYIATIVRLMNDWIGDTVPDYTWHECLIPAGRNNRPGHALTPTYITIHETANTRTGADAASHCDYIRSDAAANRPASWHVTVDDHSAYQHLPYDEVAWHAGDRATGTGNRNSLSIELCVNDDGDWEQTMRNAAQIVGVWMDQFAIPIQNVVQHNHWSNTSCPARLRAGDWARFLDMVTNEDHGVDERIINGYSVRGPFLQAYRILEGIGAHWWTVGVPLGAEIESVLVDGVERTVQELDRVWLMTEGDGAVVAMPHQVTQIQEAIGIGDGFDLRLREIATAAEAILNNARAMGG